MVADIFWFSRHDMYGFLSNYWRSPIAATDYVYPTVEHYYQASKALLTEEHEMVRSTLEAFATIESNFYYFLLTRFPHLLNFSRNNCACIFIIRIRI